MGNDILILAFILAIVFFIQSIALFFLYKTIKDFKGINYWVLGSLSVSIGFLSIYLRQYKSLEIATIFGTNIFQISGVIFMYIGSLRFIEKKEKPLQLIIYSLVYIALIFYFTIIDDNVNVRIISSSIAYSIIVFIIAYSSVSNKYKSIRKTLRFISIIFYVAGIFFVFRAISAIFMPTDNFYRPSIMQSLTFLVSLITGLGWTFGLIVMVNQRLYAEMNEAKNHFESIFNTIPDSIMITQIEDGKIINSNIGFSTLTGFSSEEVKGKYTLEINLWNNPDDRAKIIKEIQEKGVCNNLEFSFKSKNGDEIIGLYSANTIAINDSPYLISITRDITDRKRIEQEIFQKNKQLEITNAEKDKFFSIIAHDLRGPFNSFLGLTEVLAEDIQDMNIETVQKMAENMNVSAKNIYTLLENLLEWSRINRGLIVFAPQKLNAYEEIKKVVDAFAILAANKSIHLTVNVDKRIKVFADSYMLQSVIRNLISNAIKFTYKDGSIVISASSNENGDTLFSVSDNGIGVEKDMVDKLFHIDTKVGRLGTEGESSSGIGLFLCKEFVDQHKGNIWVESDPDSDVLRDRGGKGSTFYFSIPGNQLNEPV
jgi:PAS domain S-box-containing protein